jgi:hypothetical protein
MPSGDEKDTKTYPTKTPYKTQIPRNIQGMQKCFRKNNAGGIFKKAEEHISLHHLIKLVGSSQVGFGAMTSFGCE